MNLQQQQDIMFLVLIFITISFSYFNYINQNMYICQGVKGVGVKGVNVIERVLSKPIYPVIEINFSW